MKNEIKKEDVKKDLNLTYGSPVVCKVWSMRIREASGNFKINSDERDRDLKRDYMLLEYGQYLRLNSKSEFSGEVYEIDEVETSKAIDENIKSKANLIESEKQRQAVLSAIGKAALK